MATYGNFEGTFKDTIQIGKQGAKIEKSADDSFTLFNNDKTATVDIHAKEATFSGTGAVKFPAGLTSEQPGAPIDGMIRYNSDNKSYEGYSNRLWRNLSFNFTPYNITFFAQGIQPVASATIGSFAVPRDMTIPSCMDSIAKVKIAPDTDISFSITVDDNSIGSVSFNTGETDGVINLTSTELVPGDLVELVNSATPDSVISDVMINISGELTSSCPLPLPPPVPPTTWGPLPRGLGTTLTDQNQNISVISGNGIFFYGPFGGKMSRSDDKGVTWANVANIPAVSAYCGLYSDGRFMTFGGQGKMAYSDNDGVDWTVATVYPSTIECCAHDGNGTIMIAGASGEIKVSTDNGDSFSTMHDFGLETISNCTYSGQGGYWYATVNNGAGLMVSTDFTNWTVVPGIKNFGRRGSVVANGDGSITVHAGGASSRITDGSTVTPLPDILPQDYGYASHSDGRGIVVMGDNLTSTRMSSDFGQTWQALPPYLNSGGSNYNNDGVSGAIAEMDGTWVVTFRFGWAAISPPL